MTTAGLDREVRDVMTPGVVSVPADASLPRVHGALLAHGVHAVLVVDQHRGQALGWVSARGVLTAIAAGGGPRTAHQAISEPVTRISPSASAREAMAALVEPGVTHLLVSHGDRMPEGVVSALDLVAAAGGH